MMIVFFPQSNLFALSLSIMPLISQAFATSSSPDGSSSSSSCNEVIDLQLQHQTQSPMEKMESIADACEILGVEKLDVYGDYAEGEFSSALHYCYSLH